MLQPNVYIGKVEEASFRPDETLDDDEELESTPEEVVQILGFDPLEENDE